MEGVEVLELLAGRGEGDGFAHDLLDGERGTASGITVELGEDHAVEAERLVERRRNGHGVLAGHRVDHEERVVRLDRGRDVGDLRHQLLVDGQPTGGVDDDHVTAGAVRLVDRLACNIDGVGRLGEDRHTHLIAEGAELLDGGRSLEVGSHEQRIAALLLEELGELRGVGRLARALEPAINTTVGGLEA